jgi:hypothetical protein
MALRKEGAASPSATVVTPSRMKIRRDTLIVPFL